MIQKFSRLSKLSLFGITVTTICVLGACAETDFSGSSRNLKGKSEQSKKPDNQSANSTKSEQDTNKGPYKFGPISPGLNQGGWVNKDGMKDLKALFDNSGAGVGDPTGSGGAMGDGSSTTGSSTPSGPGAGSDKSEPGSVGDGSGGSPNDVPSFSSDDIGVFWVPCEGSNENNSKRGSLEGPIGAQVRLAGEFCPQRTQQVGLTVLFVVDYSGSMTTGGGGPNDPGDNCGRLRAADALLKKFATPEYQGYELKFGLVGFSTDATVRQPLQDLTSFQGTLNPATWCGSDAATALTNYRAAFEVSAQFLSSVTGRAAIYFISDGIPTVGGGLLGSHQQAGLDAAIALRNTRPDQIVLNTVFLGNAGTSASESQTYLEQVTGDPARVRLVDNADGLVEAIKALDPGLPVIQKSNVGGSLVAAGASQDVGIASLLPHKTKPGAYIYMTQPFKLQGEVDKVIANTLSVWANTSDGKKLTSEAVIDFKATP